MTDVRVHHAPLVILVARPSLVVEGVTAVLAEYGLTSADWRRGPEDTDGDGLPELMGRLCYGSFGADQGRVGAWPYHANILNAGHGSVLAHATWSFVLTRGSRALSDQVRTHAAGWAHSVESTHFRRYGPGGVTPGLVVTGVPAEEVDEAVRGMDEAVRRYAELWAKVEGRKKERCASVRGLLPLGIEAKHGFSANARALRHFIELRGARDNVPEARLVASQLLRIMSQEAPAIFQDFVLETSDDDLPVCASAHRKV